MAQRLYKDQGTTWNPSLTPNGPAGGSTLLQGIQALQHTVLIALLWTPVRIRRVLSTLTRLQTPTVSPLVKLPTVSTGSTLVLKKTLRLEPSPPSAMRRCHPLCLTLTPFLPSHPRSSRLCYRVDPSETRASTGTAMADGATSR